MKGRTYNNMLKATKLIANKGYEWNKENEIAMQILERHKRKEQHMLPIQFIYTENGKKKSSLSEHERRCEILEHNKRLNELYPIKVKKTKRQ